MLLLTNATIVSGGLIDNAIAFDGTGDIARASSSTIADWGFISQNGAAFTIVYWVKMNNFTGTQDPLATTEHNASEVGIITRIGSTRTINVTLGKQAVDLISFTTTAIFPNDTTSFHMLMVQFIRVVAQDLLPDPPVFRSSDLFPAPAQCRVCGYRNYVAV